MGTVFTSFIFVMGGIIVSAYSLKLDAIKQGLYGHLAFYLYLFGVGVLALGFNSGLNGSLWQALIFLTFGWLFVGRILTFLKLFREQTLLHLAGGIATMLWIIINIFLA